MSLATQAVAPDVSVLVPAKDEAENLPEFVRQAREVFLPLPYACEVVIVNDGSLDGTGQVLRDLAAAHAFVRVVTHRAQRGIADALRSGAEAARARVLVFYPADLQYLPADIPGLVAPILAGEADIVTGAKQGRYDRRFVSWVYNGLCRWLFGINVTDLNSVKAYRREVMDVVPTRPDWHRFMVVIAAAQGFRLAERSIPLYPRHAGKSKFGIGRIPVGVLDLLSVWFQLRFGRKPMLFFGVAGAALFLLGFLVGLVALWLRFGPAHVGFRPLLDLIMILVISGIALFGFGFVGEMVAGMREEVRSLREELRGVQHEVDQRHDRGPAVIPSPDAGAPLQQARPSPPPTRPVHRE
ncbi:MAG TPA: glycosyltransferase family 2 protein [Gemmatimonadales bacterium]|nr:glycosyltransferase family 2 protein [Gemmatimonadales bacterium]